MGEMGVPASLVDSVILEEDDVSNPDSQDSQLDDLFDLLAKGDVSSGDAKDQIQRLSSELQHYKELEHRLNVGINLSFLFASACLPVHLFSRGQIKIGCLSELFVFSREPRLYKRVCPSVRRSVGPSVGRSVGRSVWTAFFIPPKFGSFAQI